MATHHNTKSSQTMCIPINESYLFGIGGNRPLGDLRLVMEDGQELNEFGMAVREDAHASPQHDGYEESEESWLEQTEGEWEVSWLELIEELRYSEWQPIEIARSASGPSRTDPWYLNRAFGIHKVRATGWICNTRTSHLACLCQEGVFMFGADLEFCCLIARRLNKALGILLGGDFCGREGPIRIVGQPYDFYGEDELEENKLDQDPYDSDEFEIDEFDYEPEDIEISLYRGAGVLI